MKPYLLVVFFLSLSCSHKQSRFLSSDQRPLSLEVDILKSSVHLIKRKHFLVQVKNSLDQNIEISFTDVQVKNPLGKIIPFQLERVSAGKYYVLPVSPEKELQISIQDKVLGKKFKLNLHKPDKQHSAFSVISKGDHSMVMRLRLADKNNRVVIIDDSPEILVEGEAVIEDLKPLENGFWEFTLKYPENNGIIYLSVRCQEVFLEHIYRFQHIEK